MWNCTNHSKAPPVHSPVAPVCSKDNFTTSTTSSSSSSSSSSFLVDDRFRSTLSPTADILVGCYLIIV
ncbi:unnamed protein product, partial [Candidula unifasciata]